MSKTKVVATQPKDRVCAAPECETLLSVYNPGKYCSLHSDQAPHSTFRFGRRKKEE